MTIDQALFVGSMFFCVGFIFGQRSRDSYWIDKAKCVTRACARGRFFRVTEEP